MTEQHQRLGMAPSPAQSRGDDPASRRGFPYGRRDTFGEEFLPEHLCGGEFVARRIGGIDADEIGEPAFGFLGQRGGISGGSLRGLDGGHGGGWDLRG